jgi:hypothetical protein
MKPTVQRLCRRLSARRRKQESAVVYSDVVTDRTSRHKRSLVAADYQTLTLILVNVTICIACIRILQTTAMFSRLIYNH